MTIPTGEQLSQVAQYGAARESEQATMNAARLENWKRRLFRDPVEVPATVEPPKWPAFRSSMIGGVKVTQIGRAA